MEKLKNLREIMSKKDRLAAHRDVLNLKPLIVPLIWKRQNGLCNLCGSKLDAKFEIDHLIYNPRITIYELQLICHKCHVAKTKKENPHRRR